jgi:beta-glucosidase
MIQLSAAARHRYGAMTVLCISAAVSTAALGSEGSSQPHPALWPKLRWPVHAAPSVERRIAELLSKMTIDEKVGQILQADIGNVTAEDVHKYHLGSVLNGGNSGPHGDDFAPAPKWLQLADDYYAASIDKRDGGVGIPVMWGIDAVHGHSNIIGATVFPHNIGLGAAHDPALIQRIGAVTAAEIRVTGQEWTFAPTVTVPQDYRWGRAYEGYSSDPKLVSSYVGRMIIGLQGSPNTGPILKGPHVLASTKHFLADGGTFEGRDQGDAKIDETTLRTVHGAPYVPAINAGVATIMTSYSSWNGVKMAGNKGLLTDVLKRRMDFGGFIVSDWNAHGQLAGCTNASCPQAINAGLDMYMAPDSWKQLYASLNAQVRDGTVPMARLNDAVARILRTKFRLGLFDAGKPSSRLLAGRYDQLGSPAHRAVAREAVRKSLVLLKNTDGLLPIKRGSTVLVAGDGADDIGRQSGGWTISWQGTGLTNDQFPGATSIWEGIKAAVNARGGHAIYAPDGSFSTKPDVAIVVFGETPYAEFQGDIKTLQLRPELRAPYSTMQKLKAAGVPVIAVMITGRPLFVNPELNVADAFVITWLPGSEGEGVADVLVAPSSGIKQYDFSGRLPAAWPATARADGPTLFPRGYGLSLGGHLTPWRPLSEDPKVADAAIEGVYFDKGEPTTAWSLIVSNGIADSTRVTTVPAVVLGGRGRVTATDHLVQEGARQFTFSGTGRESVELTTQAPVDVSRQNNGDLLLLTTIRIDTAATSPLAISMRCTGSCGAQVAVPTLSTLPIGQWRTVGVPLKCFASNGADMTRLDAPFRLMTSGAVTFSIARVALGTVADVIEGCSR